MPDLNEFEEAERRQISENELFNLEDDEIMPKAKKQAQTAARQTPYQREKARLETERAEQAAKTRTQSENRAARAARRAGAMDGVEAAPQQPVEPAPQAREAQQQANAADEARRMEAALQEQSARDNAARNERQASTAPSSEMDLDAEIAAQFEAEMAAANERAQEARRSSPEIDDLQIQEELDRQLQAETAASDAAQAPVLADNLRLRELEAENQVLRAAADTANRERLDAISGQIAQATRADDAAAANQQLTTQLSQSNLDRDSAVKRTQDLEARNAELTARQSEMERQSESTIAIAKTSTEASNRIRQEADARAGRLEGVNQVLRRERDEAVNAVGERDQQLAQAKARNEALTKSQAEAKQAAETSTEAANRIRQEADARAGRLEGVNQVLRRERDEAMNAVGERDQQLAQAKARNEALTKSQAEAKQAADLRIADLERRNVALVETATKADVRATTETANREAAERELAKRGGELRANKESLAAEKAAREQADVKAADLDGKLQGANKAAANEKAGREAAEKEAASQKKLVSELSGEAEKVKDLEGKLRAANESAEREKAGREAAQKEAASQKKLVSELSGEGDKVKDLEGKLRAANESAEREKAGREAAQKEAASQKKLVSELSAEGDKVKDLEGKLRAANESAEREKAAREAAEKNAQELTTKNDQLTTQAKDATQARVQTEERMKTISDRENPNGDSELRKQLEQEKAARQATEAKLAATTERMIDQSRAAATARLNGAQQAARDAERIALLEAELKAARETPVRDNPIPSIEKDETRKDSSRSATAAQEDEFGLEDIDDADFDAAVATAEAKQKEAAAKAKDDEFGMDDISDADFDAAVAAAEAKQKEAATTAKAAEASRTTPAPAARDGLPALDPAHTVKGNAWYRAGKMYVPEAQYDKMLKAGVKVDKEINKGQTQKVPLEANKSAREVLLQTPKGDLHSPKVYRNVHGVTAFEARAKAEGLDPKSAAKWVAKDQTRPETLVRMKNGNLVDGKSLETAAGRTGLADKFGETNVFIENQITKIRDGQEIKIGTGNYRRADNAIEHARAVGGAIRLDERLDTMRVIPQSKSRDSRSAIPASNLNTTRSASLSERGTTPDRAVSTTPDRRPIHGNGQVVPSAPVNSNSGGVKRLNNNQHAASAQSLQSHQGDNRNYRSGSQPPAPGYQQPDQGGSQTRQNSPTTTINLTITNAGGHGTTTSNAAPQTRYSPKLDDRTRTLDPLGRN